MLRATPVRTGARDGAPDAPVEAPLWNMALSSDCGSGLPWRGNAGGVSAADDDDDMQAT